MEKTSLFGENSLVGSKGVSSDDGMTETINGRHKVELIHILAER